MEGWIKFNILFKQMASMNGTGTLQGIDQTALYYAPMVMCDQ